MVEKLTPREWEIIKLWADGYTDSEIAKQLRISTRTVQSHFINAKGKLGVSHKHEVVEYVKLRTGQIQITNVTVINNSCGTDIDAGSVSVFVGV